MAEFHASCEGTNSRGDWARMHGYGKTPEEAYRDLKEMMRRHGITPSAKPRIVPPTQEKVAC